MDRLCSIARALAIIVAVVSAFMTIPYVATILLILGAIAGITTAAESRTFIFTVTILLFLVAKSLTVLPGVGAYLADIFSAIDSALIGGSVMAVVFGIYDRLKADWAK